MGLVAGDAKGLAVGKIEYLGRVVGLGDHMVRVQSASNLTASAAGVTVSFKYCFSPLAVGGAMVSLVALCGYAALPVAVGGPADPLWGEFLGIGNTALCENLHPGLTGLRCLDLWPGRQGAAGAGTTYATPSRDAVYSFPPVGTAGLTGDLGPVSSCAERQPALALAFSTMPDVLVVNVGVFSRIRMALRAMRFSCLEFSHTLNCSKRQAK